MVLVLVRQAAGMVPCRLPLMQKLLALPLSFESVNSPSLPFPGLARQAIIVVSLIQKCRVQISLLVITVASTFSARPAQGVASACAVRLSMLPSERTGADGGLLRSEQPSACVQVQMCCRSE